MKMSPEEIEDGVSFEPEGTRPTQLPDGSTVPSPPVRESAESSVETSAEIPAAGEAAAPPAAAHKENSLLSGLEGLLPIFPAVRHESALASIHPVQDEVGTKPVTILPAASYGLAILEEQRRLEKQQGPLWRKIGRISANSLLIIVMILPFLFAGRSRAEDTQPRPITNFESQQVIDAQETLQIILQQPQDSYVLMVFDYSAANAAEMQPLAQELLRMLLAQGVRTTAVSLEPEGAALAQAAFDELSASGKQNADDAYGRRFINLGYWAGETNAVNQLIQPNSLLNRPDYEQRKSIGQFEAYADFTSVQQAGLILVLANSAGSVKRWVEQTSSLKKPLPLIAGVNAAEEVAVRPYLNSAPGSGRIRALLTGLSGAAAMEVSRGEVGQSRQIIDSLNSGAFVVLLVTCCGIVAGLIKR